MKEIKRTNHKLIEKIIVGNNNNDNSFTDCRKHLALVKSAATRLAREIDNKLAIILHPSDLFPKIDISIENNMINSIIRYQYSNNLTANQMEILNQLINKTKKDFITFKLAIDMEYIFSSSAQNFNQITINLNVPRNIAIDFNYIQTIDN